MSRHYAQSFIALLAIFVLMLLPQMVTQAAQALPQSDWYAVAWVRDSDTLHWINENGEQASMPRPTWTDEMPDSEPWLHFSADGRMLVQVVTQANGYEAIGFFNMESGQFVNAHQAQVGERFITSEHYPSLMSSTRFAIGLSTPDANAWRILAFDLQTGDVVSQLTNADYETGLPANQYYPYVVYYDIDEGAGQTVVHYQMHTQFENVQYAMYHWYPEAQPNQGLQTTGMSQFYNNALMNIFPMNPRKGFDIQPVNGFPVLAFGDGMNADRIEAQLGGNPQTIITEAGSTIDRVRWLNDGQWVGYHLQNNVQNDHWRVMPAMANGQPVPLGPNITSLYNTPDGFLAQEGMQTRLMHVTDLNFEDFAAQMGNTVFQPFAFYRVVYVTPQGATFQLAAIPDDIVLNVQPGGNGNVQAPEQICGTAPAPRLKIGDTARVTFTDGAALNVRTAPAGDFIMQIPEGTTGTVINGPVCMENFFWYNLDLGNGTGGWVAEGDNEDYYIEPYNITLVDPPQIQPTPMVLQVATIQPTQAPLNVAPPVQPTQPLNIAPVPVQPTATPMQLQVNPATCTGSPATRLAVGDLARTSQPDGTLALRTNLGDPFPSANIPSNVTVRIEEGPACRENLRMWRVSLTLNGQALNGWVAEGFGSTYYLSPGPARASN